MVAVRRNKVVAVKTRFSLRTLIVTTTCVAIFLAGFVWFAPGVSVTVHNGGKFPLVDLQIHVTGKSYDLGDGARARNRIEAIITERFYDHDWLDVYRLSIDDVGNAFDSSRSFEGLHRHTHDQWLRAGQSLPLNIAKGNGKRSLKDHARFLDIARGSALECPAIQEVLVVSGGLCRGAAHDLKL